jgi:hypothetical protein
MQQQQGRPAVLTTAGCEAAAAPGPAICIHRMWVSAVIVNELMQFAGKPIRQNTGMGTTDKGVRARTASANPYGMVKQEQDVCRS